MVFMICFVCLQGTVSSEKNELLFTEFALNYNSLPAIFRKGSVLTWTTALKDCVSGIIMIVLYTKTMTTLIFML